MRTGPLPDPVHAHAVRGRNLRASTLGEALGPERRLLAFLRHLG